MRMILFIIYFCALLVLVLQYDGFGQESSYAKGLRLAKQRAYPKALIAFKEAIRENPLEMDAYFNAGNIAFNLKQCKDVLIYFRGFLYLSPGTPDDKTAKAGLTQCESKGNVGTLLIKSEPSGIEVYIDGAIIGKTPIAETKLQSGVYKVLLKHPDFELWEQDIEIKSGQINEMYAKLTRLIAYGFLDLKTEPPGAKVFLDEKEIGVTPMEKVKLETKRYLVRFEKPGYDKWVRYVNIVKDKTVTLNAVLEKIETGDIK